MNIIDKLYDALGIKENKNMYKQLIINYTSFIMLFILVSLIVKYSTKAPERVIENTRFVLSPTRREKIINKVRNSPMRLKPKKKFLLSNELI